MFTQNILTCLSSSNVLFLDWQLAQMRLTSSSFFVFSINIFSSSSKKVFFIYFIINMFYNVTLHFMTTIIEKKLLTVD